MKGRIRSLATGFVVALLTLGGTAVIGSPASAGHLTCGSTVTASTTLDSDLLNCPGNGLIVTASNIVLDLGGRTISGRTDTNTTANEFAGIRLRQVNNVTVRNGTITNFDAGIVLGGGSGNTLTGLFIHRNINHSTLTGTINPCDLGDGIVAFSSDNNTISRNRLMHNGPYSGVSLVDDSDNNLIIDNVAAYQDVDNAHPNFVTAQRPAGNGPCGPFIPGVGDVGAPRQDVGIRVEGPGADNNRVERNQVLENDVFGITIHGYVCHPENRVPPPAPGTFPPQPNNGGNVIVGNNVVRNGFQGAPPATEPNLGDGISIPAQGPANTVCVAWGNSVLNNTVTSNARWGITLGGRGTHDNTINGNIVRGNGRDGIRVAGPTANATCGEGPLTPGVCPGAVNNTLIGNIGTANVRHDGRDENPNCDANQWRNNQFNTVFQGCERNG